MVFSVSQFKKKKKVLADCDLQEGLRDWSINQLSYVMNLDTKIILVSMVDYLLHCLMIALLHSGHYVK